MKKLFLFALMAFAIGCSDEYDDSALRNDLNNLANRVAKLEELCKQMNTNISSLQTIVTALQNNDYVTGTTTLIKDGKEIGYTITFNKSNPITIYHGKDGVHGQDGTTPAIGVKQDTDGVYYWTLNDDWLTDDEGHKIKAEGTDGKDGSDGEDGTDGEDGINGQDGITPKLKIENGYWFISYDGEDSWTQLDKATGEDGKDGEDGINGDSMFSDVDCKTSTDYVIFTLSNGTQIKLPTWSAFEALQRLCNETNTNLSALQTIVTALQNNDYITSVDPLTENGKVVGYTIKFAKNNPIVIYNGKDGADGVNGNTPVIGVKKDADGIYYWTQNGEFIMADGQKIKAQGTDGSNGSDGQDGTTPKLEIREGYWWISYDNGDTWTQLGKATGEDGQDGTDGKDGSNIKITQDENNVYFELVDGTVIAISKTGQSTPNIIEFKDPYIKTICVAAWDTDGDSELSYAEATAVTTIGTKFKGNTLIESFDELRYFTHLMSIEEAAFEECTSLSSIAIPASVETIGIRAFRNCTSLTSVNFENGSILETIKGKFDRSGSTYYWYGAFSGCTALASIEIPASVQTIEEAVFYDCKSLKTVTFQKGSLLTTIGGGNYDKKYYGAFSNCTSLVSIEIPANVKTIKSSAFEGCDRLTTVIFEKGSKLERIEDGSGYLYPHGAFMKCPKLKIIDASACSHLTFIGSYAFYNATVLELFKIGATSCPSCGQYAFEGIKDNSTLQVPSGCISKYKNAEGWKEFASIIEAE